MNTSETQVSLHFLSVVAELIHVAQQADLVGYTKDINSSLRSEGVRILTPAGTLCITLYCSDTVKEEKK